jgi:hypothetical protein
MRLKKAIDISKPADTARVENPEIAIGRCKHF